jgi:hypothetical protein
MVIMCFHGKNVSRSRHMLAISSTERVRFKHPLMSYHLVKHVNNICNENTRVSKSTIYRLTLWKQSESINKEHNNINHHLVQISSINQDRQLKKHNIIWYEIKKIKQDQQPILKETSSIGAFNRTTAKAINRMALTQDIEIDQLKLKCLFSIEYS